MSNGFKVFMLIAIAAAAVEAQAPAVVSCIGGHPDAHCQTVYRNNYPFTVIKDGIVSIVVSTPFYFDKKTFYRWVGVANHGEDLIDLSLSHFTSVFDDGNVSPAADPEKLLMANRRKASLKNILQGSLDGALTGSDPVLVTDANGEGRYVSYFTNGASLRQSDRQATINDTFQSLWNSALEHNSLQKDEKLLGVVYFAAPKDAPKNRILVSTSLTIGSTTYVF